MDKELSLGDEVLRFAKRNNPCKDILEPYIVGRVISSELSEDLSYHGSSWYEEIYEVLGEDKKIYIGTYGSAVIGDSYFLTREDYIQYLLNVRKWNLERIRKVRNINVEIRKVISQLQPDQKGIQYIHKI